jgi:hypothetical protein
MAALGWMLSQAMKTGKEAELLSSFQSARDKTPRDPQALWDWYYLCLMRNDNTQAYEAARELSRENVRRPVLDVTSSPLRVSLLSAARAAESLTPNSASSATIAAEGSGSVRCHQ